MPRVDSVHKVMISRSGLSIKVLLGKLIGSENAAVVGGIKAEIGRW